METTIKKREKKIKEQLGCNISTARSQLIKDLLWELLVQTKQIACYVCGKDMTKETFTIEHKVPWFNSETPKELFFDLTNISFSHAKCNRPRSDRTRKMIHGTENMYNKYKCRCDLCKQAAVEKNKRNYTTEKRRRWEQNRKEKEARGEVEPYPSIRKRKSTILKRYPSNELS